MTALRTTIVAVFLALLTVCSSHAGPPLATDDAATVDVGRVEIELNGSSSHNKGSAAGITSNSSTWDAEMKITSGLYKSLGFSLAVPYILSERVREAGQPLFKADGFGDMAVDIKYAFAELCGINFAIKPAVILPTGKSGLTEGRWQFGTTLIATREFDEGRYALHANLGYERHSHDGDAAGSRSNLWSGSIAGEVEIAKGLFAVTDFGLTTNPDSGSNDLPVYVLAGARYEINEFLGVNAGIRLGLTKPEETVSYLYGIVFKL